MTIIRVPGIWHHCWGYITKKPPVMGFHHCWLFSGNAVQGKKPEKAARDRQPFLEKEKKMKKLIGD
jgi:hypothetical protein